MTLAGDKIYVDSFIEDDNSETAIIFVHGLLLYTDKYLNLISSVNSLGISMYCPHLVGHGLSPGPRACANVDRHVNMLIEFRKTLKEKHIILMGHSLGGMIIPLVCLRDTFTYRKCIMLSPLVYLHEDITKQMYGFDPCSIPTSILNVIDLVSKCIPDSVVVSSEIDCSRLVDTNIKECWKYYYDDGLVPKVISFKYFANLFKNCKDLIDNIHRLQTPTYIIHGANDKLTCIKGCEYLVEKNPNFVSLFTLQSGGHNLHEENANIYSNYLDYISLSLFLDDDCGVSI